MLNQKLILQTGISNSNSATKKFKIVLTNKVVNDMIRVTRKVVNATINIVMMTKSIVRGQHDEQHDEQHDMAAGMVALAVGE